MAAGFDAHLTKPIDYAELEAMLRSCRGGRTADLAGSLGDAGRPGDPP
jgi:hypothetical protein